MEESNDIVNNVLELYKERNWKAIANNYREHPDRNKLLWVYPTEENFMFIQKCMRCLECDTILSIGCGSGLLEWMIKEATGLAVSGVEIDGAWWHSKYAPPTFIPFLVTSPTLEQDVINRLNRGDTTALLFCYFNDRSAFLEYLKHFSGSVIIIIGPGNGKGIHTDPKPFGDVSEDWILYGSQEVGNSQDFIAVYCKS